VQFLPAVYIKAETSRKENSMKNIETNFQEQRLFRSDFSLKRRKINYILVNRVQKKIAKIITKLS